MFSEEFLHYVWMYRLFDSTDLTTVQNEPVKIIHQGQRNTDSGPDFFNSQILLGQTKWAGNVEIHINSSDWQKHNHQSDNAYNSVVLHVVYNHDTNIKTAQDRVVTTIELKNRINPKLIENFRKLNESKNWIACNTQIASVDHFVLYNWLERLMVERLERKSKDIIQTLQINKNDWEETFYQLLFKYFGLKVNAEPFHLLAKNTPLKIVDKHRNLFVVEALLYGQAGFLNSEKDDEYYKRLRKEYQFLQSKFKLSPLDKSVWKFLRLRPANFPTLRIAQLAQLLTIESRLFSKILTLQSVHEIQQIFAFSASGYWDNHYQFGNEQKKSTKKQIGKLMINSLIINVVAPMIFVYAVSIQDDELKNRAIRFLEELAAEKNTIILNFEKLGVKSKNAMHTQALIELKTNYCSQKKCLHCSIGNYLLKHLKIT